MGEDTTRNRKIAKAIAAGLPGEPVAAAQVALTVAAQQCVAAGVDDDAAIVGLIKALDVTRAEAGPRRVN